MNTQTQIVVPSMGRIPVLRPGERPRAGSYYRIAGRPEIFGALEGIARPSAALRRQCRTLHGFAKPDLATMWLESGWVSDLGLRLDRAMTQHRDMRDVVESLTPKSRVFDVSQLERGIDLALRAGTLNPFAIAEHVMRGWRNGLGPTTLDCSLGDTMESDFLLLYFNNTAHANIGNAGGLLSSSVAGSFYVTTHTANPGETGNQSTSVSGFTGFAYIGVVRSSGGWTISGTSPTQAANAGATTAPACTGGSETETYFMIGRAPNSTGENLWYGALTASLGVSNGVTESFAAGACVATAD